MSLLLYGNHIFTESFLPVCNKRGAICKKCVECFTDVRTTRLHFPSKCLFHAFHLRHEPYAIAGMRFPAERTSLFSMHPESFPSFPERPPCRHLCLPRRVNFFGEYRLFVFSGVGGIYDSRPPRLSQFLADAKVPLVGTRNKVMLGARQLSSLALALCLYHASAFAGVVSARGGALRNAVGGRRANTALPPRAMDGGDHQQHGKKRCSPPRRLHW